MSHKIQKTIQGEYNPPSHRDIKKKKFQAADPHHRFNPEMATLRKMHKEFGRKNISHDFVQLDGLMSPSMMTSVQQYSSGIGKPETANTS